MNKKFDGDYLYMLYDTSKHWPIPLWISTDLNEAINILKINRYNKRGLKIWINDTQQSNMITFNISYYQLMMDFIDDPVIPRELVKEIRSIINTDVEKDIENYNRMQEEKLKEQERLDLEKLQRLAEKYGKTIID